MQLVELQSDIPATMEADVSDMKGTCASWKSYYANDLHKQDDSGI